MFYRLFAYPVCLKMTCEFMLLLQELRTPFARLNLVLCFLLVEVTKDSSAWVMMEVFPCCLHRHLRRHPASVRSLHALPR
jgi:hypothetical protein